MKEKLSWRLQDMGTLLRGSRKEQTVGAEQGQWVVLDGSTERGSKATLLCLGYVCSGGKALCVVRQLGFLPRVVASVHSSWELEEVGWMNHSNGKHQFWRWLCLPAAKEGLCLSDGVRAGADVGSVEKLRSARARPPWNQIPVTPCICSAHDGLQSTSTVLI